MKVELNQTQAEQQAGQAHTRAALRVAETESAARINRKAMARRRDPLGKQIGKATIYPPARW